VRLSNSLFISLEVLLHSLRHLPCILCTLVIAELEEASIEESWSANTRASCLCICPRHIELSTQLLICFDWVSHLLQVISGLTASTNCTHQLIADLVHLSEPEEGLVVRHTLVVGDPTILTIIGRSIQADLAIPTISLLSVHRRIEHVDLPMELDRTKWPCDEWVEEALPTSVGALGRYGTSSAEL